MINQSHQRRTLASRLAMLVVGVIGWTMLSPCSSWAQSPDPVTDLSQARRIFIPLEDLDVVIERDKQGVILPREKFDVLLTQAKANAEKNAVPSGVSILLSNADYAARITGDQLLVTVTAEITQFDDDWRELRLPMQRLAVEQALLDDAPAPIGRHPDGTVSLFSDARGKHTLKLQLSTDLTAQGSDQVAAFSLLQAPSGSLTLSIPSGKRLLIGNLQLERPAPVDQVADYKVAVGGSGGIQLRITDRAADNAADALTFATTGYGLHVAPGEVTWHALTTLQVFGKAVDRLTFSVPSQLEIADVEASGLESWELTDDPNEAQRTVISLTFGQAFEGSRKISFKGVMAIDTGKPWAVPPLRIASVTSHVGQVMVQYPAGVRLRIEETTGVRRATHEQKPTADMPDDLSKLNASEFLRFDVWQPEFTLRLTTQPKEREVQAAVAAVLDVNSTGLELQAALTVETHFAPLFELDVRLAAEWQVLTVTKDNQPLKWQTVRMEEPGVNQLRILLSPAMAMDASGEIRLSLRRDVEGWPVEADPIIVDLPELFLPQSNLTEGALVVRGDADLDLEPLELTGLDPQPLKADFERLRYQSQDTRYKGKLKITRKPSRISAQTVTVGRIDPQTFHTFLQSMVEVQGGGVRSIKVALPESAGASLRFNCPGPRIVEQKAAAAQNGERIWTLQFDQRLRGQALVFCDIELPRGDTAEFIVPQWRFVDAERQNGFLAIEASGEQRLTIAATAADGTALSEVDPLDLPAIYYAPKERLVAVYRAAASGAVLKLTEQKFEKLPIPTAICPLLEVSSILGRTGELQHRARFHLHVVGVQGLHVTLPAGTTLWATLVDGRPVEVRRSGDVYLVPLVTDAASGQRIDGARGLELFYRTEVAAVSQYGTLTQEPPTLTVESGQRTALPVEVLEQKWDLHYPEETRLVDSHSPLEPQQPLDQTSVLGRWNSQYQPPNMVDLGWELLVVIAAFGTGVLLIIGFRKQRLFMAQLVVLAMIAVVLFGLMFTFAKQERMNSVSNSSLARDSGKLSDDAKKPQSVSGPRPTSQKPIVGLAAPHSESLDEMDLAEPKAATTAAPASKDADLEKDMSGGKRDKQKRVIEQEVEQEIAQQQDQLLEAPRDQAPNDGRAGEGVNLNVDVNGDGVPDSTRHRSTRQGLLSLAIDFVAPAGSLEKTFHYVGADTTSTGIPLEVDYVDSHSGATMRVFVMALVLLVGWFMRRGCSQSKIAAVTIGLLIPLALLPLVATSWQVVLDGLFFGSLLVAALWAVLCGLSCCGCCGLIRPPAKAASLLIVAALLSLTGSAFAGDEPKPSGELKPTTTLIIPFDAGTEPLASERVFLSHEQFLALYKLANPEKISKQPAPQSGGIFEALYAAKLVPNAQHPDESVIQVTARYGVKSFVDGQLIVELPIGQVSAREAKLDGQTAALIAQPGCFKVAISKPGLHVIDFTFEVSARLSGTTGSFTLPLTAVPAGKLTFELPAKDLTIRVNGSTTVYRRVTSGDVQSVELPIDKGGDVAIAWQPQQARGAAAAVVHVDSAEAITFTDAGAAVSNGFAYQLRQGSLADTSFTLPENLRLQSVKGPDVGGWELQGEGAARKLKVIFRRTVTDQTVVTVETFLDAKIGTASAVVPVPQVAPQEVTNEIGVVAVFAGDQFTLRAEQVESLTQIDGERFATPVRITRPNVAPQLAYRFSKRPFTLNLRVTRQESQAHVQAQQAAFVTLRKLQLTSRLRYNLTGSPRSSLSISLPANFTLLDAQSTAMRDWYITKQGDSSVLTIELSSPRLGLTEVVIGGFVVRDSGDAAITFPQPTDATRLDSSAAVWLDEGFIGTLETFEGWRSIDASQVSEELRAVRAQTPVQFAFSSTNPTPSAITIKLNQAKPRLSANGLSMVTVTDIGVVYTLALQWQIDAAKTDQLSLTTPDWLAGKLDFQGAGLREAVHTDAGNGRTRWTIHLRTPVSGRYFATATATLPPATTEVQAPGLVFEADQKPLDPQRQYALLINSSLNQLTSVDPSLTESVQREDLPVVVQQEFIDQATELVRIKALSTAPRWSLHKFAQQAGAPASVNVADITTVISRDGTYRAQAIYTIKNRSRQFLALRMPEQTELLSVFVGGLPSRAVTTKLASLKGAAVQLIALPKTSASSLSFPVKVVWRGRLGRTLPKSTRLIREELAIPSPQIVSQQEDADYGIPVARTRWTVYLPDDVDAQPVSSPLKHNLSVSDDNQNPYASAMVQEVTELLGFAEQAIDNNRRVQSINNLKQLGNAVQNAKQLGLSGYDNPNDAEFTRLKSEALRRLSEVERRAKDENEKTVNFFANTNKPGNSVMVQGGEQAEDDAIANFQQKALIDSNSGTLVTQGSGSVSSEQFNFSLQYKEAEAPRKSNKGEESKSVAEKAPAKGANPNNETRQILRDRNAANLDSLNSTITSNTLSRSIQQGQQGQIGQQGNAYNNTFLGLQNQSGVQGGQQGQFGGQQGQMGAMMGGMSQFQGQEIGGIQEATPGFNFNNQGVQLGNNYNGNVFAPGPTQSLLGKTMGRHDPIVNGPGPGQMFGMGGGMPANPNGQVFVSGANNVDGVPGGGGTQNQFRQNRVMDNSGVNENGAGWRAYDGRGGASGSGRVFDLQLDGGINPQRALTADPMTSGGAAGMNAYHDREAAGALGVNDPRDVFHDHGAGNPMLVQQGNQPGRRAGGRDQAFGNNSGPAWRQPGGLSLGIELPTSGHKVVFAKSGGDPKLTLAVRSRESIRWGISLVWSVVWLALTALILWTISRPAGLTRLKQHGIALTMVFAAVALFVVIDRARMGHWFL